MKTIAIQTEFIRLQDLLKLANTVGSGGEAKVRIQNGDLTDVDVQLPDQPPQPVQGW